MAETSVLVHSVHPAQLLLPSASHSQLPSSSPSPLPHHSQSLAHSSPPSFPSPRSLPSPSPPVSLQLNTPLPQSPMTRSATGYSNVARATRASRLSWGRSLSRSPTPSPVVNGRGSFTSPSGGFEVLVNDTPGDVFAEKELKPGREPSKQSTKQLSSQSVPVKPQASLQPPPHSSYLTVDNGFLEEDASDAPWASYKPSGVVAASYMDAFGLCPEADSVSLLRSKLYEILDDKSYNMALYFLQCEYAKLPARPEIPVALDAEHSTKAQVLLGIGKLSSVPALFWSSSQYFVRAVYSLAQSNNLTPAAIYANTARIRRDLTYVGAMVGWLPLDFGIWRGKNDLDPERGKYLVESFPGVDEWWAFWYPMWSKEALTKEGVTNITFGPAPSPQPITCPLAPEEPSPKKKLSRAEKLKRRASACHTQ